MRSLFPFALGAAALTFVACGNDDATAPSSATGTITAADVSDLMPLASGKTHSSVTPMGVHYQELASKVPTASERAFLADASKSPPVPPSVSHLHLETFPVDLYPSGKPTPADVNQHAIGDCSAPAVMASLAMLSPDFVQSLIDDHGDGTFGVRMFDPAGRRIVVNLDSRFVARSATTLEAVSGKNGKADWATVLEKAMMKYLAVYPIVGRIGGIGSELASPMFTGTGDSFAFMPGTLTPAQLTRAVRGLLARGKIIIGGFNKVEPIGEVKTVTLHAYTIMIPSTASMMVSMRNPWGACPFVAGGHDGSRDGLLDVPVSTSWARAIDLRVIEPGAAAGDGATMPYVPVVAADAEPPRISND